MALLEANSPVLSSGTPAESSHRLESRPISGSLAKRAAFFLMLLAAIALAFHASIRSTISLALQDEVYSFILLVPALCLFVFFIDRNRIFHRAGSSAVIAAILAAAATALLVVVHLRLFHVSPPVGLMCSMLSLAVMATAAFALCFGAPALQAALFPLGLALFLAPLPRQYMVQPIQAIRHGSADIATLFFHLAAVPVFRQGYVLSLPRLNIEIAEQCSGIHSSLALFIGSLLFGHMFLRAGWKKLLLVLAVFPIISLTNGFRIFVISMLSMYVNPAFMYGKLHRDGGFVFFTLALIILIALIKLLRSVQPAKGLAHV